MIPSPTSRTRLHRRALLCAAASALLPAAAWAQDYPNRPIKPVVPLAASSSQRHSASPW